MTPTGTSSVATTLRCGRVTGVDHRDTAVVARRAEPIVASGPVGESPLADVCVALVSPHVGVEAPCTEVGMTDCDHVARGAFLCPSLVHLLRLLLEVALVLQLAVSIVAVRQGDGRSPVRESSRMQ